MCYFVTIAMPAGADVGSAQATWKNHGVQFQPLENAALRQVLPVGEHYGTVTRETCDCGTAIGCARRSQNEGREFGELLEKKARGLRRKGWSEAKIERWLLDKQGGHNRRRADSAIAVEHDARRWARVLRELLAPGRCSRVGVLLHFYSGNLTDEPKSLERRESVRARDLTPEFIMAMHEDVLYEFRP